jgi:hypothetical protein
MPVLEPFSATYLYGGASDRFETAVSQDADLNVSFTEIWRGKLTFQVVMHESVVYVRFFDSRTFDRNALRDIGVKSGEWFPYEEWRELGYKATENTTFPCDDSVCEYHATGANPMVGLDTLPYEARVPASLAYSIGVDTPDKACIRLSTEILFQGSSSPEFKRRISRSENGRWIIAGPCQHSMDFDDQGRITSLSHSDDGTLDPDSQDRGLLTVSYAVQSVISAPDTSWFAANKPAVKIAIKAAAARQKALDDRWVE